MNPMLIDQVKQKMLASGTSEGIAIAELLDSVSDAPEAERSELAAAILNEVHEWAQTGLSELTRHPQAHGTTQPTQMDIARALSTLYAANRPAANDRIYAAIDGLCDSLLGVTDIEPILNAGRA